jgi:hypothetical protein
MCAILSNKKGSWNANTNSKGPIKIINVLNFTPLALKDKNITTSKAIYEVVERVVTIANITHIAFLSNVKLLRSKCIKRPIVKKKPNAPGSHEKPELRIACCPGT